jgi:hypothetical protein
MKKLICSAIAMSLLILPVLAAEVQLDSQPLKGQGYSLIEWKDMDPDKWLNIDHWLLDNEAKTKYSDWQVRLRDSRQLEQVGRMITCSGSCSVYRGTMPVTGNYLTRLIEGDEIRTEINSIAWIFLNDGTIVRLGPEGSLSLQEINFSQNEVFIMARLNRGHIFWHSRQKGEFVSETSPETDSKVLPLRVLEANQQHFEREIFKSQNDRLQLGEILNLDEAAINNQFKRLNELKSAHDKSINLTTRSMLVSPNITLVSNQMSLDFVYIPGSASFYKNRGTEDLSFQLRGYDKIETSVNSDREWYEVAQDGRMQSKMDIVPSTLQLLELLTRRIKSLELARELFVERYSLPIFSDLIDPKKLAVNFGYSLWSFELKQRVEFLLEYNRRIETSNLKAIDNLFARLVRRGEKVNRELNVSLYQDSLNHYLKSLKGRYNTQQLQVREMSDLQYYVWTLRNGKL